MSSEHDPANAESAKLIPELAQVLVLRGFTERQAQIAARVLLGWTLEEIAAARGIGLSTCKNHMTAIYVKFKLRNRAAFVFTFMPLVIDVREKRAPTDRVTAAVRSPLDHPQQKLPGGMQ